LFLPFEISAYCNDSHLGSKITFGQVFKHKILCHFIFSKYAISVERKSSLKNLKYKLTNRQLKKFLFLSFYDDDGHQVMAKALMAFYQVDKQTHTASFWRKAVENNFKKGPLKQHPSQMWFNLGQQFQRRRFKCDLL
jgi:hypothetical protein